MRRLIIITSILGALLAAGCGNSEPKVAVPATATVSGTLSVPPSTGKYYADNAAQPVAGEPCTADDGYDEITAGTQVVVTDSASATIAIGSVDPAPRLSPSTSGNTDLDAARCVFTFTVAGVPLGKQFYGVEVARRGRVQYSEAQITAPLKLTLG